MHEAVRAGLVRSAHDVSEGGLAVAVAECCMGGGVGARVELPDLFGEGPGGVVVSGPRESIDKLAESCSEHEFLRLGEVLGDRLVATGPAARLSVPVVDLATAFETGIPAKFS